MIRERLLGEMQFLLDHPYNESAKNYIMDIYKEMQKLVEDKDQLIISLQAQEEITMTWYNKVKKIKDFLNGYEENRNSFKWTEQDYIDTIEEIKDIVGSDK